MLGLLGVDLSELVESGIQGIVSVVSFVLGLLLLILSLLVDSLFWPGVALVVFGIVLAFFAITGVFDALFD